MITTKSLSLVHVEITVFDDSLMLIAPSVKGVLGVVRVAVAHGYPILTMKSSSLKIDVSASKITLTVTVCVVKASKESLVDMLKRPVLTSTLSHGNVVTIE